MKAECPYPDCRKIILEEKAEEIVKGLKYLMCPYCGRMIKNPEFEEEWEKS